ncbi:SMI1/KNR4 family protein [Pseudomonas syringae]|uniref:SMI1/KNR4 family protein n=1 Tax=Pseudomonas syringae TaxID=317 RepID=UPI003F83EB01
MITPLEVIEQTKNAFPGRSIYFSPSDIPQNLILPQGWGDFGILPSAGCSFPDAWRDFSSKLPWVLSLLDKCLLGTAILGGSLTELLYVFYDTNGLYYYIGGEPLANSDTPTAFGEKLSEFYKRVHNGFTFHPANSMGPQKLCDCIYVSDLIDEENTDFAKQWLTILSNGGGDYFAIDLNNFTDKNGVIWWHEQPLEPELGMDVFGVMDTWISIFLEDTKLRDDVLKY